MIIENMRYINKKYIDLIGKSHTYMERIKQMVIIVMVMGNTIILKTDFSSIPQCFFV